MPEHINLPHFLEVFFGEYLVEARHKVQVKLCRLEDLSLLMLLNGGVLSICLDEGKPIVVVVLVFVLSVDIL